MTSQDFWNDPIFARVQRGKQPPAPAPATAPSAADQIPTKQTVPPVELSAREAELLKDDAPKFKSWEGFWADPVFEKVTGRRERLPPGQQREFWKYEVDESVAIGSLFPSLSSSAFNAVTFEKSAIEFRSKDIFAEPAGLYFRTSVVMNGALDEIFSVFKHFLGDGAKPTLRLSAFLGVTPMPDNSYTANGLELSGSLDGLMTPFPPVIQLLTVVSLGVRLKIGGQSDISTPRLPPAGVPPRSDGISFGFFGELLLELPGVTGPPRLNFSATFHERDEVMQLDMTFPGDGSWNSALGADSLRLEGVLFTLRVPMGGSSKKSEAATGKLPSSSDTRQEGIMASPAESLLSITASARWRSTGGKLIDLSGAIYKGRPDLSYFQGTIERLTWNDIKRIFSDMYSQDLKDSDHDITCEQLTVRVSKAAFVLQGSLTINGRQLFDAKITITKSGVAIRASVDKWDIDDGLIVINNASLTLLVGRASTGGNASEEAEHPEGPGEEKKPSQPAAAQPSSGTGDDVQFKAPQTPSKGWTGGLHVTGEVLLNGDAVKEGKSPHTLQATLVVGKQADKMFWVLCGTYNGDLSLSKLVPGIVADSDVDLSLKSVSLVASSIDQPDYSLNTNGYTIRKGFFICARLQAVPLMEVKGKVKKPAPGDDTYVSVGWVKGSKFPSISVFLPSSMNIELGPRFTSKRFQLELKRGQKGFSFAFIGAFLVKVDDKNPAYEFALNLEADPIGASGSLVFKGDINDPFGLSKRFTIGPELAIQLNFNWVQLASTGLPIGAGLGGGFYLDGRVDDPYSLKLFVCENPKDMLIEVKSPLMSYTEIIRFVAAAMEREIPLSDVKIFEFRDVLIYGSMGASFGGTFYPAGFRMKGTIIIFDHEAGMDCSLTTEGFKLKAWIQTFKLGPLSIGGDAVIAGKPGTFAVLDMNLGWEEQKFILKGFVEIFNIRAAIDVHMQICPTPKFYFDFEVTWTDLLRLKVHAEMVNQKAIDSPGSTDFIISADFQQTIIQQIAESLHKALKATHEAIQKKLDSAKEAVADAERRYKEQVEEAQKKLKAARAAYEAENDALDRQLDELERQTKQGKDERRDKINKANDEGTSKIENTRTKRGREVEESRINFNAKETEVNNQESNGAAERNQTVSESEQRKRAFMSQFGDTEASLERGRNDVQRASNDVNSLKREMDELERRKEGLNWLQKALALDINFQLGALGVQYVGAKIGLAVAEGVISAIINIMRSDIFESAKQAWYRASELVDTVIRKIALAVQQAKDQLANAAKALQAAEAALRGDVAEAERIANEMVNDAKRLYDTYAAEQEKESAKLRIQLQQLKNSATGLAVATAEGALEVAKNNTAVFKLAEAGLDAVKAIETATYKTLDELVTAASKLCDIRNIHLRGVITSDPSRQSAFTIYMDGTLVGQNFAFEVEYTPGETRKFLEGVAKKALGELGLMA